MTAADEERPDVDAIRDWMYGHFRQMPRVLRLKVGDLLAAYDALRQQLDDVTAERNELRAALTDIAQYHPAWTGQHVNNAPNRSQLIERAFDALAADQVRVCWDCGEQTKPPEGPCTNCGSTDESEPFREGWDESD